MDRKRWQDKFRKAFKGNEQRNIAYTDKTVKPKKKESEADKEMRMKALRELMK